MIGVFDSGVGGLTVVRELRKQLPEYDLIYFGDTARAPYGNKSKETIVKYALQDADFLIGKGAKIIVIACNTASSTAYGAIKEKYADTPIFEVITPAVWQAIRMSKNKKIGVIATRATVNSGIYEKKLKNEDFSLSVFSQACPLFVPFIEEGWLNKTELKMIARRYLFPLKRRNIDTLILGCTHYPIIKDIIQAKIGSRIKLIDSAEATAKEIKEYSEGNLQNLSKCGKLEIFVSDKSLNLEKLADKILGKNIKIYESGNIV